MIFASYLFNCFLFSELCCSGLKSKGIGIYSNDLRKRLISAKMKECKDTKVVNVSDTVYTLVKKIGDGGFSSVYHVYDDKRKSYAIKIVNLLNIDGYTDKDLMNEIELLKVFFSQSS